MLRRAPGDIGLRFGPVGIAHNRDRMGKHVGDNLVNCSGIEERNEGLARSETRLLSGIIQQLQR